MYRTKLIEISLHQWFSRNILTSLGDVTTTDLIASNRYGVAKGHDAWWTTEVHQKKGREAKDRWIRWGIIMNSFSMIIFRYKELQFTSNPPKSSSLICFDLHSSFWLDSVQKNSSIPRNHENWSQPGFSRTKSETFWQLAEVGCYIPNASTNQQYFSTSDLDFLIFLNSTTVERIRKMPAC